jgi:hypothetical protein
MRCIRSYGFQSEREIYFVSRRVLCRVGVFLAAPRKKEELQQQHISYWRFDFCSAVLCSALLCCLYELLTLESLTLSFIERLGHFKQLLRLLISSIDSVSDFDGRNQSCWLHPPPLPPPPHLLSSSPLRIGKSGGRKEDDE